MSNVVYTSRDPAPLARVLGIWLWIDLAGCLLAIPVTLAHIEALSALPGSRATSFWDTSPEVEAADLVLIGLMPLLVANIVAGFLALKWIYRVSRNAHSMATGLTVRPPWAVGWFFIPLANLLMPFRGVRQAWQASVQPDAWATVEVPALLRFWWAAWLVTSGVENLAWRLELRADIISEVIASDVVGLVGFGLRVVLDLAFIQVVRRLTSHQVSALHNHAFA